MKPAIQADIGIPQLNQAVPYITDGTWSLYEMIGYLLDYSGSAHVSITSFSLSDDSIRYLQHLKETGSIKTLTGLFDPGIRKTKTPLLFFALSVFDTIMLSPNHSKIILIEGDVMDITVFASANLGRNRRIEAGIIDTRPETFSFVLEKLKTILSTAICP